MKKLNWFVFLLIVMTLSVSLIIACNNDDDEDDDEDSDTDDDAADDDSADDDSADDDSVDDDDDDATDDDDDTTDDDDDSTGCSITDICTLMYDKCDGHDGWTSVAECEGGWFGRCTGTMDEVNYMDCVCLCFDSEDSCDDFIDNCEIDCWTAYCT